MTTAPDTLWYFGYGSNMDPRTFLGRRRMRPVEVLAGRLDDWQLTFDLPVGPGERGVANVRPQPGAHIWGVLYRISGPAFARLDRTEGVPQGAYARVAVGVQHADRGRIEAYTYQSSRGRAGRKPSRRYLGLLLAGARHHGLPDDYIAALRRIELAVDEREAAQGSLFQEEP